MQFSAEIWHRSDNIQALGDFSKLIGEKSPIRRQRVKATRKKGLYAKRTDASGNRTLESVRKQLEDGKKTERQENGSRNGTRI